MSRASGVLMHVSSLYGDYSIGSFGTEAMEFVDFLADGGFGYWQVLPFCMSDENNSPYKSFSAFGANPFFIDLPTLFEEGLLTEDELTQARQSSPYVCEYDRLNKERISLLSLAAGRANAALRGEVARFIEDNPPLASAAKFMALKKANAGAPWYEWSVSEPDTAELFLWQFIQYEFYTQWNRIKNYANDKGIKIIGDIPIYVAHDSCDVWANREQFLLDSKGFPTSVAGVPPDYFSEEGQLWGNPLYDWEKMKSDGYLWWSCRMEYMLRLFDGVRIDHFRGLESYWSIPVGAKSAKEGSWVKGPGKDFIDKLKLISADKLVIAEDLGDITPEVAELLEYSEFPGMRVLQFAFLGDENTPHLPHNYCKKCVAYTGTHDNNTLLGYVWEMDEAQRRRLIDYCQGRYDDWDSACLSAIRTVLASHADTAILPIQDIFLFGRDTRMNTPGTVGDNWQYRITKGQLEAVDIEKFARLNDLYGRKTATPSKQ